MAIVGPGLLGGSLGLAARAKGLVETITGIGRSQAALEEARRYEAIDEVHLTLESGLRDADLIVLCTPVAHIVKILPEVTRLAKPEAVITDVGSTKGAIVALGEELTRDRPGGFAGSHPMAGSEKSGVRFARASLFEGQTCFVAKTQTTSPAAFSQVAQLWREIGCRVVIARPQRHDELAALVSHLPHLVAVALVQTVAISHEDKNLVKGIIGNGFRDTTRIASGGTSMWEDICRENSAMIARASDKFQQALRELIEAVAADPERLRVLLDEASDFREYLEQD